MLTLFYEILYKIVVDFERYRDFKNFVLLHFQKDGIRDHVPSIDTVGLESAVDATVPNTLESPFKRQKLT